MKSKPLYIQIWEHYRKEITDGKYKYGDTFPTERELEKVHGCDRKTIRKALNLLVDENLLVRVVGKGTYVNEPDVRFSMESIRGFSRILQQEGIGVSSKLLFFGKVEAGYRVAKALGIYKGEMVYKCVRLRNTGDTPVALEMAYIKNIFPEIEKFDFNIYSLYDIYENYGHGVTEVEEEIQAIEISEQEAQYLEIKTGDPVLLITDISKDCHGEIIEYNRAYTVSDRFRLSTDLI